MSEHSRTWGGQGGPDPLTGTFISTHTPVKRAHFGKMLAIADPSGLASRGLDIPPPICHVSSIMNRNPPTLYELLLRSDFGRADPSRVRELLDAVIVDRTGGTIVPDLRTPVREVREREAA